MADKIRLAKKYSDMGYEIRKYEDWYGRSTEDYEVVIWYDKKIALGEQTQYNKEHNSRVYRICSEVVHVSKKLLTNEGKCDIVKYEGKVVNEDLINKSFKADKDQLKQFYKDLDLAIAGLK